MEEEEDIHRYSQQGQGNLMWTRTQEDVPEPFISLKAFEVTGVQLNTNRDLGDSTTGCSQAQGGQGARCGKDTSRATPGGLGSRNYGAAWSRHCLWNP